MSGYCKYYKQKKQVSYDNGVTWQDVIPYEYQKGSLYESDSTSCGAITIERWVNSGTTCSGTSGYDKYYLQVKQISYDGGSTWTTTSDYQLGELIQRNSSDCGYTPPTVNSKIYAEYSNGLTYSAECDSNTELSSGDTTPPGYYHSAMTYVEIGNCVDSIGYGAFYRCSGLTSINIPSGITSIDDVAFYNCTSLSSLTIPNSVTSIGETAFGWCSGLKSCTIGSGIRSIDYQTFANCSNLSSVTFSQNSQLTHIGKFSFSNSTKIESINIPNSVTEIDESAFINCSGLTSVTLGNSITTIGRAAFANCANFTNISIPSTMTYFGDGAFSNCNSLNTVYCLATTPPTIDTSYGGWLFPYNFIRNGIIYVPAESLNAYKTADNWSTYASRIQAIP